MPGLSQRERNEACDPRGRKPLLLPARWWTAVILLGSLALAAGADSTAQPNPIDKLVTDALAEWDVPGAAVVVVTPDRVLCLNGYGRRELGRDAPLTADTIFPLASCTKAFTTTLLAMLADEGKLRWDDHVRKH